MRGRLSLLILTGALLAGCSSQGVVGAASSPAGAGSHSGASSTSGAPGSDAPTSGTSASGSAAPTGGGTVPGEDATVIVGTGKVKVTLYEDFRCPPCKVVHDQLQPVLNAKLAGGQIQVEYHAVDMVDHSTNGKGSLAAANAASCAFQAAKFQPYREALFAAQPADENDDAFADPAKLISVAQTVQGLDSPAFEACVRAQPFAGSIENTYTTEFASNKMQGVPAVLINGTQWPVPSSGNLATAFTQALAAAGPDSAGGTPQSVQ